MNDKVVLLRKIESFIQLGFKTKKHYIINDKEEEIEFEFSLLNRERIAECFNHIATYWSEEHYKKCLEEWKSLQCFIIPKDSENGFKCTCGVAWTDKKFICPFQLICPACDEYSQPYLSNPINKENVIKYISPKYFKYIFEEYEENILEFLKVLWSQYEDQNDLIKEIDFRDNYLLIKQWSEYGMCIKVYDKFTKYYIRVNEDKTISSFCKISGDKTYLRDSQGLYEDIYSNRTEYHINGEYKGTGDDKIDQIINKITTLICDENLIPSLYGFIKSDEELSIISKEEFDIGAKKILETIVYPRKPNFN